ncbi:MAG TPA: tRNA (adenosine(37)-N6)-dimethylallyltransferase MiaA [Acidimicrobiales bacterium]|nr:tRNA (adenosine(37)-N6)-dimethylallyltransferase MiaA [Acidimicrobiales bacterium]
MPADPSPVTVALVGPTASGKSELAVAVAEGSRRPDPGGGGVPRVPVELVSVDSMAVYRGMDIGTAKPSSSVRARVGYHLVDLVEPSEEFTVQQFQAAARTALAGISARGHRALLVGGTGLYLRSVVDDLSFPGRFPEVAARLTDALDSEGPEGSPGERATLAAFHARLSSLDPVAAGRLEPTNRRRLVRALEVSIGSGRPFSSFGPGLEAYPPSRVTLVGMPYDPEASDRRIGARFAAMMDLGLLDEVRGLAERPGGLSRTARQALGYRELLSHLEDGVPVAEAVAEAVRRTRAFARRQWAWFRRDPRIVWLGPDEDGIARIAGLFPDSRPPSPRSPGLGGRVGD